MHPFIFQRLVTEEGKLSSFVEVKVDRLGKLIGGGDYGCNGNRWGRIHRKSYCN